MRQSASTVRLWSLGIWLAFLTFLLLPRSATPCSSFVLRDGKKILFGKNYDHYSSLGLLIANKRGLAKTALLKPPEKPARWVSKYGSLTFNQVGREFPMGGMNERGLVIEQMWLAETKYPKPDERPALMELQWIQYQLDNCGTVEDVLACQSKIRISQSMSPLHFLVCDRSGQTAAIEFLDGRCVFRSGPDLAVEALTNDTYDSCLEHLASVQNLTWEEKAGFTTYRSKDRFMKIERRLEDFQRERPGPAKEYAFDMLASLSIERLRGQCTAWSIVYDLTSLEASFKTHENRLVRTVRLQDLDFRSTTPVLALDLAPEIRGDASSQFIECTPAVNDRQVKRIFEIWAKAGFLKSIPPPYLTILAHYPETLKIAN